VRTLDLTFTRIVGCPSELPLYTQNLINLFSFNDNPRNTTIKQFRIITVLS
jgi:hypothetical protein